MGTMAYTGDNVITIESMAEDVIFDAGEIHTIRAVACANCEKMTYGSGNKKQFVRQIRLYGWKTKNHQWHCEDC